MARRTNPSDFATGDSFANALFGQRTDQTFFSAVQRDMRVALGAELPALDRSLPADFPGDPPKWKFVQINTERRLDWVGYPYILVPRMQFGTTVNLFADQMGVDLYPILQEIYRQLVRNSPRRKAETEGVKSVPSYRKAHEIWLSQSGHAFKRVSAFGGQPRLGDDSNTRGLLVNRTEYSSVLETPDYSYRHYRTYQRTFVWARRKFGQDVDITLIYSDPLKEFGGLRYTKPWAKRKKPIYAVPVIFLSQLNTMPLRYRNQMMTVRRRTLRQRRNVLAQLKKRRR